MKAIILLMAFSASLALAACDQRVASPAPSNRLAKEIDYCDWVGYEVRAVMDAFEKEHGVKVNYLGLATQESFIEAIRNRKCDVYVMGNELIQSLIADALLTQIDYRNVPNFKNIAANFRDPSYDPKNRYSIPFRWGTTGLLVRADTIAAPIKRWADFGMAGKSALWEMSRHVISIALKAVGYSVNSESPMELEAALNFLLKLKPNLIIWPPSESSIVSPLIDGRATMAYGWSFDALLARAADPNIVYILPDEGAILWAESLVIGVGSERKATAEAYINFMLRPEVSAQVSNILHFATANEAARPWIESALANDPIIFPPNECLKNAELILQLSPKGAKLYSDIWSRFLGAGK